MVTSLSTALAEATVSRQKVILVFNRHTKVFIAAISYVDPDTLGGQDVSVFVEAEMDLHNEYVVSAEQPIVTLPTVDDWKIVNKDEMSELPAVITEEILNNRVAYKITTEYSVVEQINIIAHAVKAIAVATKTDVAELDELLSYVELVKETNKAQRTSYMENPDYVYKSSADLANEDALRHGGGYFEHLGPQQRTKGTVF